MGHAAVVTGAGLQPERVTWDEMEPAFASRIQTGAIVNLGSSDVDTFLEEAQPVFLEVMERLFYVLPYYVSKTEKARHVDLLLIQNYYVDEDGEECDDDDAPAEPLRFHYVWIKNMSALIGAQVSKRRHKQLLT